MRELMIKNCGSRGLKGDTKKMKPTMQQHFLDVSLKAVSYKMEPCFSWPRRPTEVNGGFRGCFFNIIYAEFNLFYSLKFGVPNIPVSNC